MKNKVRGSKPQANDARWSTALLLSFFVAIVLMFGSMSAKTGDTASTIFTAKEAKAADSAQANKQTQPASTHKRNVQAAR